MCASCWAVTAASVMGDRLNILIESARQRQSQEGEPRQHQGQLLGRVEVSAQYLLNCVPGQRHCGYPGSSSAAMAFVAAHGIPTMAMPGWLASKTDDRQASGSGPTFSVDLSAPRRVFHKPFLECVGSSHMAMGLLVNDSASGAGTAAGKGEQARVGALWRKHLKIVREELNMSMLRGTLRALACCSATDQATA